MAHVFPHVLVNAEDANDAKNEAKQWLDDRFEFGGAWLFDYGDLAEGDKPLQGDTEEFRKMLLEVMKSEDACIRELWESVRDEFSKAGPNVPDYDTVRLLLYKAESLADVMGNKHDRDAGDPGTMGTEVLLYDGREDSKTNPLKAGGDVWLVRLDLHY